MHFLAVTLTWSSISCWEWIVMLWRFLGSRHVECLVAIIGRQELHIVSGIRVCNPVVAWVCESLVFVLACVGWVIAQLVE